MSSSGTSGSGEVEEETFTCRLCPNASFTAAERDIHRQFHRDRGDLQPKSGTAKPGRGRPRVPAPAETNETIFVRQPPGATARAPTPPPRVPAGGKGKRQPSPSKKPGPKRKKTSSKYYMEPNDFGRKNPGA